MPTRQKNDSSCFTAVQVIEIFLMKTMHITFVILKGTSICIIKEMYINTRDAKNTTK